MRSILMRGRLSVLSTSISSSSPSDIMEGSWLLTGRIYLLLTIF